MRVRTGRGWAPCHHGELLQGVFLDASGRRCRGLVTMPLPGPGTHAEFTPMPDVPLDRLTVWPADRGKARRAAMLAVEACARRGRHRTCGGTLRLHGDVPVGLGMGSSTSDVLAAVRAVAAGFGRTLPPNEVARLAVRAEGASDPLMLDHRPTLFAQREGRILEHLGESLPPTVVVSCLTGGGKPVDTLGLRGDDAGEEDVAAYERLRAMLRVAVAKADVALVGRVATESGRRNQRILPKEEFDRLCEIADRTGAAGVQVAHSGNVAGLLFDPALPDLRRRLHLCVRDLHRAGIPVTRLFDTRRSRAKDEDGRAHRRRHRTARSDPSRRAAGLPAIRDHEGDFGARGRPSSPRHGQGPAR